MADTARTCSNTRTWIIDLIALVLLCAPAYFFRIPDYGPANWQEAQRVVVTEDMRRHDSWLVPTINGRPYIAKPPLLYWLTLATADVRARLGFREPDERISLTDLRIVVGVTGVLGVLLTYVSARVLLSGVMAVFRDSPTRRAWPLEEWSRLAAICAAVFLAGGVLYFRSARIGEIDILLAPLTTASVTAIAWLWRHREAGALRRVLVIGAAVMSTALATLAKGPPAILIIALAAWGGIALFVTVAARTARVSALGRAVIGGCAIAVGVLAAVRREASSSMVDVVIGSVCLSGMAAVIVWLIARVFQRPAREELVRGLHATHPLIILGTGALALWGWGWMVRSRIGGLADATAVGEAEDNLRVLVPESPIVNLEAAAYGVGLGSLAAIVFVVWFVKDRKRLNFAQPGWAIIIAWAALSIIAMSMLGKGVGRYLTPAWPAVGMLGGMFAASAVLDARRPRVVGVIVLALGAAVIAVNGWWYGTGRVERQGDRTPRGLVAELVTRHGVELDRLTTLDFRTPAIDYEAGHRWIQPVGEIGMRPAIAGGEPWTMEELAADVQMHGARTLLVQSGSDWKEQCERAGLRIEELRTDARFMVAGYKVAVVGVRVSAR